MMLDAMCAKNSRVQNAMFKQYKVMSLWQCDSIDVLAASSSLDLGSNIRGKKLPNDIWVLNQK